MVKKKVQKVSLWKRIGLKVGGKDTLIEWIDWRERSMNLQKQNLSMLKKAVRNKVYMQTDMWGSFNPENHDKIVGSSSIVWKNKYLPKMRDKIKLLEKDIKEDKRDILLNKKLLRAKLKKVI